MKYIEILFLIILALYPFSYAAYNLRMKNRLAAVGSILIAIAAIVFPMVLILTR